jgi:hypothetical protein
LTSISAPPKLPSWNPSRRTLFSDWTDPVRGEAFIPGAKINSDGRRRPETALARTPGTYRIALIGDSFVAGFDGQAKETGVPTFTASTAGWESGTPNVEGNRGAASHRGAGGYTVLGP